MEGNWQYVAKLYLPFFFDPPTPVLGIHLKYMDIAKVKKNTYTELFIVELFSIEKDSNKSSIHEREIVE